MPAGWHRFFVNANDGGAFATSREVTALVDAAALLPMLVAALLWLPFLQFLYLGLGLMGLMVAAVLLWDWHWPRLLLLPGCAVHAAVLALQILVILVLSRKIDQTIVIGQDGADTIRRRFEPAIRSDNIAAAVAIDVAEHVDQATVWDEGDVGLANCSLHALSSRAWSGSRGC